MGEGHLEAPVRTKIIYEALQDSNLSVRFKEAKRGNEEDVLRVHGKSHYQEVAGTSGEERHEFTADTITNEYTFDAAMTAAGAAVETVNNIGKNSVFSMVRPPGHHATEAQAMGFCFFNNIAIAAAYIRDKLGGSVAIIDIDNHHGNGTQDIFYYDDEVLYLSLHATPMLTFPGTGFVNEVGGGKGTGRTVNIPLPYQTKGPEYLYAFDTVAAPIIKQFDADYTLVSLGLDALEGDPYGALSISSDTYFELGQRLSNLTNLTSKTQPAVFLEGGYKYDEIGKATVKFFTGIENRNADSRQEPRPSKAIQSIIHTVRGIQRNHWYGI